jgi:threonine dehydratase
VARAVNPSTRIIGVQAEGAPALYQSWRTGRRVTAGSITTFAEGLATREPFELPLQLLPRLVDELMLVSDAELVDAIRLLLETAHQVTEGAGAAAVAGAVRRRAEWEGKRVGMVLSGGNITMDQLRAILNAGSPRADRPDAMPPTSQRPRM